MFRLLFFLVFCFFFSFFFFFFLVRPIYQGHEQFGRSIQRPWQGMEHVTANDDMGKHQKNNRE